MGDARNAAGEVIGQAWGETKQDVLDKLQAEHPSAPEMRIKSVEERPQQAGLRPGRIVYFVVDGESAAQINRRRADYYPRKAEEWPSGAQAHVGNAVNPGDVVPAMVTRVWGGDIVNLKVMLDGNDTYWATSIRFSEARELGTWAWMFEGQRERYQPDRTEASPASS